MVSLEPREEYSAFLESGARLKDWKKGGEEDTLGSVMVAADRLSDREELREHRVREEDENFDDGIRPDARTNVKMGTAIEGYEAEDSLMAVYDKSLTTGSTPIRHFKHEEEDSIMDIYDKSLDIEAKETPPIRHFKPEDDEEMESIWVEGGAPKRRGMEVEEFEDIEELTDKEKRGVPAVMRCFDRAKVYVKAGNGGNGVVAFRREKFVPFGGPSGGSGGNGGDVFLEADTAMNSLLPFRRQVHFRASRGAHGKGSGREGANGVECVVRDRKSVV